MADGNKTTINGEGLDGHWHKVLAMVMQKLAVTRLELTMADALALQPGAAVVVQEHGKGLTVRLCSPGELAIMQVQERSKEAPRG